MTVLRPATLPLLIAAAFGLAGCADGGLFGRKPAQAAATAPAVDPRQQAIDEQKEQLLQQLAICESGSWGPQAQPIYGGRGAYHGRFQFTAQTFRTYTLKRDGTALTTREAIDGAQDYYKAMSLTSYMIFDLGETWHWPLCSRKLGIPAKVKAIHAM